MAVSRPLETPRSIEPICMLRSFSLSVSFDDSYLQILIRGCKINLTFFEASVSSIIFYAYALEKYLAYGVFQTLWRRQRLLRSGWFSTELACPGKTYAIFPIKSMFHVRLKKKTRGQFLVNCAQLMYLLPNLFRTFGLMKFCNFLMLNFYTRKSNQKVVHGVQ